MAHNWHAITYANLSYFNSFDYDYIVIGQLTVFLPHRSHIVSGLYALSDLCTSPSPRLVSLLKRTLPVYSTNDVRGKQLIFSISPSPILPVIQLYQEIFFIMSSVCRCLFIQTAVVAGGKITIGDMAAKNGVIHFIDKVRP